MQILLLQLPNFSLSTTGIQQLTILLRYVTFRFSKDAFIVLFTGYMHYGTMTTRNFACNIESCMFEWIYTTIVFPCVGGIGSLDHYNQSYHFLTTVSNSIYNSDLQSNSEESQDISSLTAKPTWKKLNMSRLFRNDFVRIEINYPVSSA